jgi:hypothetical protein
MKPQKLKILILMVLVPIFKIPINAQTKVFIPDTVFRNHLNLHYPTFMDNSGDSLIIDSAATLTGAFDCSQECCPILAGIYDLTGIEYFTHITELNCSGNFITAIPDLSAITTLTKLICWTNEITSLPDLSANTELTELNCHFNHLTNLPDLSANSQLSILTCSYNQLTSLPDLSSKTKLSHFNCASNMLVNLPNLSPNAELTFFDCASNRISCLPDLSAYTALKELVCFDNKLECLPDLSANQELTYLDCAYNKLDFSDARTMRIADALPVIEYFIYDWQDPFGDGDTISINEGEILTLSIASQDSALSYQWFKDGVIIDDETDTIFVIPSFTLADSGSYTCKSYGTALESPPLINGPGISEFESEPFLVILHSGTGTKTPELNSDILIYPNPGNDIFNIRIYGVFPGYKEIRIVNTLGQQLFLEELKQTGGTYTIQLDLRGYSSGIYYIQLLSDKGVIFKQFLKE